MTFGKRSGRCALCRRTAHLTFHHLIPRKLHRRTRFRKLHDKRELARGIEVCQLCHRALHRLHDEMTLGTELATLERLRADPKVARHVAWARKQNRGVVS
ncbi:MAG: hypothetical protein AAFX58_01085 [Pseudomonadota bacterium]